MERTGIINGNTEFIANSRFLTLQNSHPENGYILRESRPDPVYGWNIYYSYTTPDPQPTVLNNFSNINTSAPDPTFDYVSDYDCTPERMKIAEQNLIRWQEEKLAREKEQQRMSAEHEAQMKAGAGYSVAGFVLFFVNIIIAIIIGNTIRGDFGIKYFFISEILTFIICGSLTSDAEKKAVEKFRSNNV